MVQLWMLCCAVSQMPPSELEELLPQQLGRLADSCKFSVGDPYHPRSCSFPWIAHSQNKNKNKNRHTKKPYLCRSIKAHTPLGTTVKGHSSFGTLHGIKVKLCRDSMAAQFIPVKSCFLPILHRC